MSRFALSSSSAPPLRHQWLALTALLAVIAGLIAPVFDNGYVYDDVDVIERGDVIHDPNQIANFFLHHTMYVSPNHRGSALLVDTYRPVTLISFVWDSALSGRAPWAYHLTNFLMHLGCVALVFFFVKEFVGPERWAFALFSAAVFGLSPHPAEAHVWINGRSDLFCTFFGLGSVLIWRRTGALRGARGLLAEFGTGLVFLLGLLSKEPLLLVLPCLVLWPEGRAVRLRERLARCSAFLVASLAYLAMRLAALGAMRSHESREHLLRALYYFAPLQFEGLAGALYPRRLYLRFLAEEFALLSDGALVLHALLLAALSGALVLARKRLALLGWGVAWFASTLSPVAIVASIPWPGFGRYLYLPSAGLAVAVASTGVELFRARPRLRRLWLFGAAGHLLLLAVLLRSVVSDYRDAETLYTAAIEQNPAGAAAYYWLGVSRMERGRSDEAIGPLVVAHQRAGDQSRFADGLLMALIQAGKFDGARELALEGIARYGKDASSFYVFMLNDSRVREPERAAFYVLECLRAAPGSQPCGDALTRMLIQDPLRALHLRAVRALLVQPRYAAVKAQTAPLVDSLGAAARRP